jgi:hypothetical protein
MENKLPAPTNALELSIGGGYIQPFGTLQSGRNFQQIAHEGIALDLGLGVRVSPQWSIGIDGGIQDMNSMTGMGLRGARAGFTATYHAAPFSRVDPFVRIGFGYRALWQRNPGGMADVFTHGGELASLGLGLDFRASRSVSLGPMIGGDLDMFLYQSSNGRTAAIASPRLSTFVFAGLQGRFDIGGDRVTERPVVPAFADR